MDPQQNFSHLDAKNQGIVTISTFTASGDLDKLKTALHAGLDAGLTISEIKEVLVQLYAYCGFPRSLNAITTFMTVLDERKGKGIQDHAGVEPDQVEGSNRYEQGTKTLEVLTGKPQNGAVMGATAFAPGIDKFLKEHLFADIFGRGVLTYQQRELATISVLATLSGLDFQLQAHLRMGMNVGLTEPQLREAFALLEKSIGNIQAGAADQALSQAVNV